jgi:hypothetical protein
MARSCFLGSWRQFKLNRRHSLGSVRLEYAGDGHGAPDLKGRAPLVACSWREELTAREPPSVSGRSPVNAFTACYEVRKAAIYLRAGGGRVDGQEYFVSRTAEGSPTSA